MGSRFRYSWLVLRLPIFLRNVLRLKASVRLLGIVGPGYLCTTCSNREGRSRRIPSLVMVSHLLPDSSSAAACLLASSVPRGLSQLRLASRGAPVAPLTVVEVLKLVAGQPAPDAVLVRQEHPRSGWPGPVPGWLGAPPLDDLVGRSHACLPQDLPPEAKAADWRAWSPV
jgi:hypothetical protein